MRPLILTILLALIISPIQADEPEFENEFEGIVDAWETYELMRTIAILVYRIHQTFRDGELDRMATLCTDQYYVVVEHIREHNILHDDLPASLTLLPKETREDLDEFFKMFIHGDALCGWVAEENEQIGGRVVSYQMGEQND